MTKQKDPMRVPYTERSGVRWPDPKTGPYWVGLYWAQVGGRNECVGVAIFNGAWLDTSGDSPELELLPGQELAPLRSTDVRIPLDRLVREHYEWAANLEGEAGELARHLRGWRGGEGLPRDAQPAPEAARVRGWPPEHLPNVAAVYVDAWRKGQHPTKAVAEHFGVSKSAAAKWVAKCRESSIGLLPPTERGKPRAVAPPAEKPARRTAKRGGRR